VTFLFTDIVGSTEMWERFPEEMGAALARHDTRLREAIETHRGYVFATGGDGFAVAFDDPSDALGAALMAQRSLRGLGRDGIADIYVRMGIHAGRAEERNGDYFGPDVNRAARVMSAAGGDQIVLTAEALAALQSPRDATTHELGWFRLKGVPEPVQLFGASAPDLPWVDQDVTSARIVPGNLPTMPTEFIGRRAFLDDQADGLRDHRLVTLVGTGGVGKTRIAIELARMTADRFPDGAWMVDLGPIGDPSSVISAVASTLSLSLRPGKSLLESIVDALSDRQELLLLDNCEHVIEPVSELVEAIVTQCPRVTVVATSREPIGVAGERVVRVASLDLDEAVELFYARAQALDDSLIRSVDDAESVGVICRRLDGIPLAIELAASRIRSLTLDDLARRLHDRFRLLRGSGRGAAERHQTLRATVTWSYQLLSDAEQIAFNRLSVFSGGFDLAAAEAVCGDLEDTGDEQVIDIVTSLVDKSMVSMDRTDSVTRYRLLETLRQYGEERLADSEDIAPTRDRHLEHYLALAVAARSMEMGPQQLNGDLFFEREWDNIRAAVSWAGDSHQLASADDLLWATFPFAVLRTRYEAGEWALGLLAPEATGIVVSGRVTIIAAAFAMFAAEWERSLPLCESAVELSTDPESVALAWHTSTISSMMLGRFDAAVASRDQAQSAVASTEDPFVGYWVHYSGMAVAMSTNRAELPSWIDRLRDHAHRYRAPWMLPAVYMAVGSQRFSAGDHAEALLSFRKAVEVAAAAGSMLDEGMGAARVITATLASPDAVLSEEVHDMLVRIRDTRSWTVVASACEPIANRLARDGHLEPAAILLGGLLADPASSHRNRLRSETTLLVNELDDVEQFVFQGSSMSPSEMIEFAIAQIPSADDVGDAVLLNRPTV